MTEIKNLETGQFIKIESSYDEFHDNYDRTFYDQDGNYLFRILAKDFNGLFHGSDFEDYKTNKHYYSVMVGDNIFIAEEDDKSMYTFDAHRLKLS